MCLHSRHIATVQIIMDPVHQGMIDRSEKILEWALPDVHRNDEDLVERLIQEKDYSQLAKMVPKDCISCDGPNCKNKNPRNRCTRCINHYYCTRDCQKDHFKVLKRKCKHLEEVRGTGLSPFDEDGGIVYPDDFGSSSVNMDWTVQNNPVNDNCHICLKEPVPPMDALVLPCRHQFCAACIMEWQKGNVTKRGQLFQGNTCPTCRKPMPIVEQALCVRADELNKQAKGIGGDDNEKKQELFEEALAMVSKMMSSDICQRTTPIMKAEILIDAGRPMEAAEEIDKLMEFHYKVSGHPLTKVCGQYEAAFNAGEEEKAKKLMDQMEFMAPRMDPNYTTPFEMIQEAYRMQAMAYMAAKEWKLALSVFRDKLFGWAWKLRPRFAPPSRNHEYMLGTGRCLYELGDYKDAVTTLQSTLLMSRDVPSDSFKYLALSYKGAGDLDAALVTMNKAVLYQSYHPRQSEQVCKLYQELLQEWKLTSKTEDT